MAASLWIVPAWADLDQSPLTGEAYQAADGAYRAIAADRLDAAVAMARRSVALAPNSVVARRLLIDALTRANRREEALAVANAAIAAGGAGGPLLAQRGYLLTGPENAEAAAADFAAALEAGGLEPDQEENVRAALRESRFLGPATRAFTAADEGNYDAALAAARTAREIKPDDEGMARVVIQALNEMGRNAEALREADAAIAGGDPSGLLLAQRAQLRQQMGDLEGAARDFAAALETNGLTDEQVSNVRDALEEVRFQKVATDAFAAAADGEFDAALALARQAQRIRPGDEGMARVVIQALSETGRVDEALREADAAIARGKASSALLGQRGNLRRGIGDVAGAVDDFAAAIQAAERTGELLGRLPFLLADARSALAEQEGDVALAEEIWRAYLETAPEDADAWFALGLLLARQGERGDAGRALEQGLQFRQPGNILLQTGTVYAGLNGPKASRYLRQAIDARTMGDPTLAALSARELEGVRNLITSSDQSIRTTLVAGTTQGRALDVGGSDFALAGEVAVRFDGRYLPVVPGLETYLRGGRSQDETDFAESQFALGLRWRPFDDVNFALSAELEHRLEPSPLDQLVLGFGYSMGGLPYPYERGWERFGTVAAFGTLRIGEERYLQNVGAAVGALYKGRAPVRYVAAGALAVETSYDSAADEPFAMGIGPGLTVQTWLGGDAYRSYDAMAALTIRYLLPVAGSDRLEGLRAQVTLQF